MSPQGKVSFIFLCDGPCSSSSWKDEDKSVYWARRDALARISIMSLWQGPGVQSAVSDDCSLLFHEYITVPGSVKEKEQKDGKKMQKEEQKEELLAAMTMCGYQLVPSLPVPNEGQLMRRWREAASTATKFPQQAQIGSVAVRSDNESGFQSLSGSSGLQMSFTPWREAAFLSNPSILSSSSNSSPSSFSTQKSVINSSNMTSADKNNNSHNNKTINNSNSSNSSSNNSNSNSSSTESFDKRFILKAMQKECSLEFLRKHGMNGSEELILKKKNKKDVLAAYSDWTAVRGGSSLSGGNNGNGGDNESDGVSEGLSSSNNSSSNNGGSSSNGSSSSSGRKSSSTSKDRLEDTFAVLYNRHNNSSNNNISNIIDNSSNNNSNNSRSKTIRTRITVLLLHEDYPHELPVFGDQSVTDNLNSTDSRDGSACHKRNKKVGGREGAQGAERMEGTEWAEEHRVICVLGAVRDASDAEVAASIVAAERMGFRCVGANLGRTAEFTSKIVAALIAHAAAGRLGAAVDALPSITASTAIYSVSVGGEGAVGVLGISKLVPMRSGGWSWDGRSNKTARLEPHAAAVRNSSSSSSSISSSRLITDSIGGSSSSGSTCSGSSSNSRHCRLITDRISFHAILWLPYNSCDIRLDTGCRERFHSLIQTAVCCLWRSRVASEAAKVGNDRYKDKNNDKNSKHVGHNLTNVDDKSNDESYNNEDNDNGEGDNDNNTTHKRSKKRKTETHSSTLPAPSPPSGSVIQPELSLVFSDGSTASISQAGLALSMAARRMAAPSEYQVLLSIIELLRDPVVNSGVGSGVSGGVNAAVDTSEATQSNNLPAANIADGSSKLTTAAATATATAGGGGGGDDAATNQATTVTGKDVSWVDSLKSLLPQGLNKKERKRVMIVDLTDLITVGDKNKPLNAVNADPNSHNRGNTPRIPCLSDIAYSTACGCSSKLGEGARVFDSNEGNERETNGENNGNGREERDERGLSHVIVLLRPSAQYVQHDNRKYGTPFNPTSATSSDSINSIGSTNAWNISNTDKFKRLSALKPPPSGVIIRLGTSPASEERTSDLDFMLNAWVYGEKSHKHDMTKRSALYCLSSLFPSTINNEIEVRRDEGMMSGKKEPMSGRKGMTSGSVSEVESSERRLLSPGIGSSGSSLVSPGGSASLVSPGIAVSVLQHWAYHRRLLPCVRTAIEEYSLAENDPYCRQVQE